MRRLFICPRTLRTSIRSNKSSASSRRSCARPQSGQFQACGDESAKLDHLVHVRRQLKLENRAFVTSPRHPNTTVMAFDNRMADGKADSHTTFFGREHWVENMIVVGWIDTRASILNGHLNKIRFANAGSYAQYSLSY